MATIAKQVLTADGARSSRILWEALGDADDGEPQIIGEQPDGSIQFVGTFASATVVLEGTNDGTNWITLRDDIGSSISLTSGDLKMFLQRVWKVRPRTSGGSGTDIDAYLILGS